MSTPGFDLFQRVVESERRLARQLVAPIDGMFDLLEESGAMMRRQSEALAAAGRALQESAELMNSQAQLFERTVVTLRQPSELAKAAMGLERRPR